MSSDLLSGDADRLSDAGRLSGAGFLGEESQAVDHFAENRLLEADGFAGGSSSLEEMIRTTERGILVTRLWYIREVDPYQKILTGMTRDGTSYVEGGQVRHAVRNLRFNQSIKEMLKQMKLLGPAVRAAGEESFEMVVPAMRVANFHFSEVTKY